MLLDIRVLLTVYLSSQLFLSSLGECGNPDTVVSASSAERIYLIVSRFCIEACCCQDYFLCHRYKACHHLGHQDVPMDASALQNGQGGYQTEDAHEHLEAGQADVQQASDSLARGDHASAILKRLRLGWDRISDSFRPHKVRILPEKRSSPVAT